MSSTNKTSNLELTQYIGTDIFNPLTDYNVDMSKIDTACGEYEAHVGNQSLHVQNADCSKNATVYNITGINNENNKIYCMFTIPMDYKYGDSFSVNGDSYIIRTENNSDLPDGIFLADNVVSAVIDTEEKIIYFRGIPTAAQINAASVTTQNITYFVDVTNGFDTNNGLQSTPFKTIQHAINLIPQIVNHTVTINVSEGTYNEDVVLLGHIGSGKITINGGTDAVTALSYIVNSFHVYFCTVIVDIIAFNGVSSKSTIVSGTASTFASVNNTQTFFHYCQTIQTNMSGRGISSSFANTYAIGCVVSNKDRAFYSTIGSQLAINNCSGTGNNVVEQADGGYISNVSIPTVSGAQLYLVSAGGEILGYDGKSTSGYSPNLFINGDFQIWQRGTSFTKDPSTAVTPTFTADRCRLSNYNASLPSATLTVSKTDNGIHINTDGKAFNLSQKIEMALTGKTVTLSMKIKSDVAHGAYVNLGGQSFPISINTDYSIVSSTYVYSTSSNPETIFYYTTGNDNDGIVKNIDIAWVKLEIGSVPTAFEPRPYSEELSMCQRYFYSVNQEANQYESFGIGYAASTTVAFIYVPISVNMRNFPSVTTSGAFYLQNNSLSTNKDVTVANFTVERGTKQGFAVLHVNVASGLTAGTTYEFISNNDANARLNFDAEIY